MTTMVMTRVRLVCQKYAEAAEVVALAGWLYSHTAGVEGTYPNTTHKQVEVHLVADDPLAAVREALQGCPPEFKVYESMEVL